MDDLSRIRRAYAEFVTARLGSWHDRVFKAFCTVPREAFLDPGPWQLGTLGNVWTTLDADPAILYHNTVVALLAAKNINNGEPALHAKALAHLDARPGDRVVHVGAGAGYYTAILGEMVGRCGTVTALEVEPVLAGKACANLAPWPQVTVQEVPGLEFDVTGANAIYVNAGLNAFPGPWLAGLAPGGRLVMPLTGEDGTGVLVLVTKMSGAYGFSILMPAVFIPMRGRPAVARPQAPRDILMKHAAWGEVGSLRLAPEPPDETCWYDAGDWWLSTRPVAVRWA